MEYTLLFNALHMPIKWHDENKNGNLFKSVAGTVDPNGTGWVSTGITFKSGEEDWTYYVCRIVELALDGKSRTTIAEVLRLIDYLVAFKQGKDLVEIDSKYEKEQ